MKSIEERAKEYSKWQWDVPTALKAYIAGATEQKAIDEEVRLKKCDDMTQEECDRESAFAEWYRENGKGTPTYSDAIEWARKEVIDKACDWFDTYLMEIGYPDDWMSDSLNVENEKERFRKAMMEL